MQDLWDYSHHLGMGCRTLENPLIVLLLDYSLTQLSTIFCLQLKECAVNYGMAVHLYIICIPVEFKGSS